jgi:hypothetical protein
MVLMVLYSPVAISGLQPILLARLQSITCCFVRIRTPGLPISKDEVSMTRKERTTWL